MHSNRPKWILTLLLAVFAAFAAYPPRDVTKLVEVVRLSADGQTVLEKKFPPQVKYKSPLPFPFATPVTEFRNLKPMPDGTFSAERHSIVPGRIKTGLDIAGGAELVYQLKSSSPEMEKLASETIDVLRRRIDPTGTKEYRIQEQGHGRILIQVPRATQTEISELKGRLERLGQLEFRICALNDPENAADEAQLYKDSMEGRPTPGYVRMDVYDPAKKRLPGEKLQPGGDWYLVSTEQPSITGRDLRSVKPSYDNQGRPAVAFVMKQRAAKKFGALTDNYRNKPLAIVLDGKLRSAPIIRARITTAGIIEGYFSEQEIRELVAVLRAGSLPVDLELEMESTVGPTLGGDSIRRGIRASIVGGCLVLLLMAGYYMRMGLVADGALMLNLLLLLGVMGLMRSTLTLPGMAGIALTMGMAVDANVLIYERIREERGRNKQLRLALKNGYERAFLTIFDSNLTTLLTAIVLYMVGTGPVRGFAVTLSAGIIMSMFTALVVTRLVFEWLVEKGILKEFKMREVLGGTHLPFTSWRRIAYVASVAFIVVGLVVFFLRGRSAYDIDFTGGTLVHFKLAGPKPVGEVRSALREVGYEGFEVQGEWSLEAQRTAGTHPSEFAVRIREIGPEKEREKYRTDIESALKAEGLFKSLEFAPEAVSVRVGLQRPVEEDVLVDLFVGGKGAGFSVEEITSIVGVEDKKAKQFEIRLPKGSKPEDDIAQWLKLVKAVESSLPVAKTQLKLKAEEPVERLMESPGEGRTARAVFDVRIESDKPTDTAVLDLILWRERFRQFGINEVPTRSLPDKGRFFRLSASAKVAAGAAKSLNGDFSVPKLSSDAGVLKIELEQALAEQQVAAGLSRGGHLPAGACIVPVGVEFGSYDLFLGQLGPGKRQEKVQEDIMLAFKGNLYQDDIAVELEELAAEPAGSASGDEGAEGEAESGADQPEESSEGGRGNGEEAREPTPETPAPSAQEKPAETDLRQYVFKFSQALPGDRISELLDHAGVSLGKGLERVLLPGATYDQVKVKLAPDRAEEVLKAIREPLANPTPIRRVVSIGAMVAGEMKARAWLAVIFSWFVIIIYIAFRFHGISFGICAVIALVHDIGVTLAAISIASLAGGLFGDMKLSLTVVAAFLTIIGYSINDTIVVYDRIRENLAGIRGRHPDAKAIDTALNQTLGRTIMTSLTTLVVVLTLYLFAGSTLRTMAFAIAVGVLTGTYSSVFVASQLLVDWKWVKTAGKVVLRTATVPFWAPGWVRRRLSSKQ